MDNKKLIYKQARKKKHHYTAAERRAYQKKKNATHGLLYIKSTRNNTIATISNHKGDVLCWSSGGEVKHYTLRGKKLKGYQKSSQHAAFLIISSVCEKARKKGIKRLSVFLNGYGKATYVVMRVLKLKKFLVIKLKDVTPISFNGCRAPKKMRKKLHLKKRRR